MALTKDSSSALQHKVEQKTISRRLDKYLTHERILVLEKLLGIFLAALAVQMIIYGLVDLHIITSVAH
jgi:hypothetical protein